jgi:hypothetical protein
MVATWARSGHIDDPNRRPPEQRRDIHEKEGTFMRRSLVVFAVLAIALMPVAASAASAEAQAAVDGLCTAVDGLGTAGDVDGWVEEVAEVKVALEILDEIDDPDLDLGPFEAVLADLDTAIDGGDLDEMAAAALLLDSACADLVAAAADDAPEGGVSTGGGGTAGNDLIPVLLLGLGTATAGAFYWRRRSQN